MARIKSATTTTTTKAFLDTALLVLFWFWLLGQILWHESSVKEVFMGQAKLQLQTSQEDTEMVPVAVCPSLWSSGRTERSGWDRVCLAQPWCLWNAGAKQNLSGGALLLPIKVINSVQWSKSWSFNSKNLAKNSPAPQRLFS